MFFLFFCFLCLEAKEIEIDTELGVRHYSLDCQIGDTVLVKSLYYPFIIIFNSFNDDTTMIEYNSLSYNSTTFSQSSEVYIRFLPTFITYTTPFSFLNFFINSNTTLKFTLATLPGMCKNGFYISTKETDIIQFSKSAVNFFKLKEFDDKCIIFGSHNTHILSLEMKSYDSEDQFFIYSSYTNFTSISGNSTFTIQQNDPEHPPFARIVTDDLLAPESATILFSTIDDNNGTSRNQEYQYEDGLTEKTECQRSPLDSEALAIGLLILLLILGISCLTLIATQCLKRQDFTAFNSSEEELPSIVNIETVYVSKFSISRFSNHDLILT